MSHPVALPGIPVSLDISIITDAGWDTLRDNERERTQSKVTSGSRGGLSLPKDTLVENKGGPGSGYHGHPGGHLEGGELQRGGSRSGGLAANQLSVIDKVSADAAEKMAKKEEWFWEYSEMKKLGYSREEWNTVVDAIEARAKERGVLSVGIADHDAEAIIDSGELKGRAATGKTTGTTGSEHAQKMRNAFDEGAMERSHVVYGTYQFGAAPYGEVVFVLNKKLLGHSTATYGDTLDQITFGVDDAAGKDRAFTREALPGKYAPRLLALSIAKQSSYRHEIMNTIKTGKVSDAWMRNFPHEEKNIPYIEIQIFPKGTGIGINNFIKAMTRHDYFGDKKNLARKLGKIPLRIGYGVADLFKWDELAEVNPDAKIVITTKGGPGSGYMGHPGGHYDAGNPELQRGGSRKPGMGRQLEMPFLARVTTPYKQRVEATVAKIENNSNFYSASTEKLYAVNSSGKIVVELEGDSDSVSVSDEDAKKLKNAVTIHNHPSSFSFSVQDVVTAIRENSAEERVVSQAGTYILTRPKTGWKLEWAKSNSPWGFDSTVINEAIHTATDRAHRMGMSEYDGEFNNLVWEEFSKITGVKYKFIKRQ